MHPLWVASALSLALWSFWGMHMDAIRFTTGTFQTYPPHAVAVSNEQSMCATCFLCEESLCIWCCCPCSTRRVGTGRIMNTSMLFSNAGSRAILNKFFVPLQPRSTRPISNPSKTGVQQPTLHWPMSFGSLQQFGESVAVHLPWTHSTSRAPSKGPNPDLRTAPGRVCLGKHLRARRLRPQARRHTRYRRPRKKTPTWKQQVLARISILSARWSEWLATCAHQPTVRHRALMLQVVVSLLRYPVSRHASAQEARDSANQCVNTSMPSFLFRPLGSAFTSPVFAWIRPHTPFSIGFFGLGPKPLTAPVACTPRP